MKKWSVIWAIIIMIASGAIAQNEKERRDRKEDKKVTVIRPIPCQSPNFDINTGYFRNDYLDSTKVEAISCPNPKLERYKND